MLSSIFPTNRFFVARLLSITMGVLVIAEPALALTPNDQFFAEQWYLPKIGAETAWNTTTGSSEVVVAVLDTGVDIDHPDLVRNIWRNPREEPGDVKDNDGNGFIDDYFGWNFVENNNNPRPSLRGAYSREGITHGTVLAGIIAAVGGNREGVAGLSWQTKIMPIRVLGSDGSGDAEDVVRGIDYAVRNGAHIINLSFTTFDVVPALAASIRRARDAGVLVVAAAGNDTDANLDERPAYPVCADGSAGENWVLGVTAVDRTDRKSGFANHSSLCIDLSAPGEDVFSTQFIDPSISGLTRYGGPWAGTSVATPIVSGVAALVRAAYPKATRTEIVDILKRTAVNIDELNPIYRGRIGRGRVNAAGAVERALVLARSPRRGRIAVAGERGAPRVWLFDERGIFIATFLAYGESFTGGVRLAAGDVDGDGAREIITGAGPGGGPHLRIWSESGVPKGQFFAFDQSFRGGITVASGDVDGDGKAEIIVGSGPGIGGTVKVYDRTGRERAAFRAYAATFLGGVEVASRDLDGDGKAEIVTGAGPGGGPHVRIFDGAGMLKGQFFAFETSYRGGVLIGTADIDGDRRAEILVSRGKANAGEVRIFGGTGGARESFIAFVPRAFVPVTTAAIDRDGDGREEVVVAGRLDSKPPEVRMFNSIGVLLSAFTLPTELGSTVRLASF